jgi:hypothetical protein
MPLRLGFWHPCSANVAHVAGADWFEQDGGGREEPQVWGAWDSRPILGEGLGDLLEECIVGFPPILGVGEDLWVLLVSLSQPRGQCTPGTGSW